MNTEKKGLSFTEKNNFVVTHASKEYFDKDLDYYKELFPNSPLIPQLVNAPEYQKQQLDARMLTEILNSEKVCTECILENRGIITMAQKQKKAEELKAKQETAKTAILALNLEEDQDYNSIKQLCIDAGLEVKGDEKADYLEAIKVLHEESKTKKEDNAAEAILKAKEELKGLDLTVGSNQAKMAAIATALDIETENKKATTLAAALQPIKDELLKPVDTTETGTQKTTTETTDEGEKGGNGEAPTGDEPAPQSTETGSNASGGTEGDTEKKKEDHE